LRKTGVTGVQELQNGLSGRNGVFQLTGELAIVF